jgi:hypothetical protein
MGSEGTKKGTPADVPITSDTLGPVANGSSKGKEDT